VIFDLLEDIPFSHKIPLLSHHILSCVAYSGGIITGRLHFWAVFDGMCEFTNIFLNVLLLTKTSGGPSFGPKFKDKLGVLFDVNGVLLWLSFLIFRICLFPLWLFYFFQDYLNIPQDISTELWITVSTFEFTFYPLVTLFLMCLSTLWFWKLTIGVIKTFKGENLLMTGGDDVMVDGEKKKKSKMK
jgi:hypothetical protein